MIVSIIGCEVVWLGCVDGIGLTGDWRIVGCVGWFFLGVRIRSFVLGIILIFIAFLEVSSLHLVLLLTMHSIDDTCLVVS